MAPGAHLQAYPDKPIRLVVPFPPGASTDLLARSIATSFQASMEQPVIVDNKPGAGGALGSELIAKSAPDGYSLLIGVTGSHGISVSLNPRLPYDPLKDFEPISLLVVSPLIIVVNARSPTSSLIEFVSKARSLPGQITFGTAGHGTTMHLAGESLNLAADIKLVHVAYRGSAAVMSDLASGQIDSAFGDLVAAMPLIQSGRLRALAVTSATRHPLLPDVPTVAENGFENFEVLSWQGLFAPARTDAEIVSRLNSEAVKALADTEIKDQLSKLGLDLRPTSPDEFRLFIRSEIEKWARVIRDAKVQLQ